MSFSVSPFGPLVPVSIPPWPGSRTTSGRASAGAATGATRSAAAPAGRVSSSARRKKVSRSVLASSIDMRAGPPGDASATDAASMRAGLVKSTTMRDPPAMTRPKRNALIRPRPTSPVFVGRKSHLRQIDHHAIRVGKGKGAHFDLAAEFQDEVGFGIVTAETGFGRHREQIGAPAPPGGTSAAPAAATKSNEMTAQLVALNASIATPLRPSLLH